MSLVEVAQVPTQGLEIRPSRHLAPVRAKICAEERKKNKKQVSQENIVCCLVCSHHLVAFCIFIFWKHCNPPCGVPVLFSFLQAEGVAHWLRPPAQL